MDRLSKISHADAIVILESAAPDTSTDTTKKTIKGSDQRGVNTNRWTRFIQEHAVNIPPDSIIHKVIDNGLTIDVWSVEHFLEDMQVFHTLFDIHIGGWIAGIQLPRATARHNNLGVFLWYQTGKNKDAPPPGADQDWRFLEFFQDCYSMAGYTIRKVARSIIMQRQELLRTLTPSILNHEINARISFFKGGLDQIEKEMKVHLDLLSHLSIPNDSTLSVQKVLRKISKQLVPQANQLYSISESVMGLTRRIASGPTDPIREIRSSIELLSHAASEANVLVEIDKIPDSSIEIVSDPALLMHIMVNLIKNGIEALQPLPVTMEQEKRIWVNIDWSEETDSNHPLQIDVCDNGLGIPSELGNRIFEAGITTKKLGHGLGLAICTMIAGYLGGELLLYSPVNPTQFRLTLPKCSPKIADLEEELKNVTERP